jgi:hypothetical protein
MYAFGDVIAQLGFEKRDIHWDVVARNVGLRSETAEELEEDKHLDEDKIFDVSRLDRD